MVSRHVACCCHLLDISQCYRMYLKKWLIAIYSGFMLLYFLHFPSVSGRNTIKRKTHISVYLWSKRKIRHFSRKHIETESNSIFECESFLKWIIPPVTKPPSCDQFHSRGSYKSDVKPSAVKNKSVHPWCHERHIISPISIIYQTFA